MSRLRRTLIVIGCVVAVAALIGAIVVTVGKGFTAQEKEIRSDWSVETGDLLDSGADAGVNLFDAGIDTELRVLRLVPAGSNAVGFTYYDVETQTASPTRSSHSKNAVSPGPPTTRSPSSTRSEPAPTGFTSTSRPTTPPRSDTPSTSTGSPISPPPPTTSPSKERSRKTAAARASTASR